MTPSSVQRQRQVDHGCEFLDSANVHIWREQMPHKKGLSFYKQRQQADHWSVGLRIWVALSARAPVRHQMSHCEMMCCALRAALHRLAHTRELEAGPDRILPVDVAGEDHLARPQNY